MVSRPVKSGEAPPNPPAGPDWSAASLPMRSTLTTPLTSNNHDSVVGRKKILVVDDDAQILQVMLIALTSAGYDVVTASSNNEALRICEDDPGAINLIIADLIMPHQTGRHLVSKLATLCPRAKLLLISGYPNLAEFFDVVVSRSESVASEYEFLQKPFAIPELTRTVRTLLGSSDTWVR